MSETPTPLTLDAAPPQQDMMQAGTVEAKPVLGTPFYIGMFIILVFFGGFMAWSALAPLESAAIAVGEVSVETKRRTIQHLEGGIVGKILVHDGDVVEAGQVLIQLDETQPRANLSLLQARYDATKAHELRLRAERDQQVQIKFTDNLEQQRSTNHEIAEILSAQELIFKTQKQTIDGKIAILNQRIIQLEEEKRGLNGQVRAQNERIELSNIEIKALKGLVAEGMSSKQRMLELQRDRAETKGEKSQNQSSIARVGQHIVETQMEINDLFATRMHEVVQELREIQTELYELREKLRSAEDILQRTNIIAPTAGTIFNLSIHTKGGVITPGMTLMDIVPTGERLIIEARLDPMDIDIVKPGLPAHVRFTALNQRRVQPVEGKVIRVSADRLLDDRTGEIYYRTLIALNENFQAVLGDEELYPGMQVEVMIVTGARTPLDYFFQPITNSVNRAFREE